MKRKLTTRTVCTLVLGGWTAFAWALSLSPVTGSAVVGRPLDLTAPIRFDGMTESADQLTWLRTSMELKSTPAADAAQRAAATALWQALNAQPRDLLRTAERLRGLEGEMVTLRRLSESHRLEMVAASETLQVSRSQRRSSLLLVTLLALLAGGSAAFFWHRSRREGAPAQADSWFGPLEPRGEPDVVVEKKPQPLPVPAVQPTALLDAAGTPAITVQVHNPAGLKVDALHAAQQQGEFFASLGQIDEAVAVLSSYLEESSEKPVLAFFELFRIYHGTGMRMEYEELQSTFRQTFAMDVPSFDEYREEQRELELYQVAMMRIGAAWPSEPGQEVIAELLFKKPATPRELLSLEAYRELLWLYDLGQEIVYCTGSPAGLQLQGDRGVSHDRFILPWAQGEEAGPEQLSLDRLTGIDVAPELNAFGLDIDLTAMRGGAAAHAPEIAPQPPTPQATEAPVSDTSAFDSVMDSLGRRS